MRDEPRLNIKMLPGNLVDTVSDTQKVSGNRSNRNILPKTVIKGAYDTSTVILQIGAHLKLLVTLSRIGLGRKNIVPTNKNKIKIVDF